MTLSLDATATARAAAAVAGAVWLVELDFASGLQRYTLWPQNITSGGHTWLGMGSVADVSMISESEDTTADKVTFSLSIVNTALLAACIGPASEYRGRAARMHLQLIDDTYQPAGAYVPRWAGYMDRITIERESGGEQGTTLGSIKLECQRAGLARARNFIGLRRTDAQQKARFAGDKGLEYTQSLIETPALWLSKRFQAK